MPVSRVLGPLPENAFVAAARDSIPETRARVTTASTRGNLRGRGRGRSCATRQPSTRKEQSAEGGSSRGRGRGKKRRTGQASTSAAAQGPEAQAATRATAQDPEAQAAARERGYNIGPGSAYYMLFGDERQ